MTSIAWISERGEHIGITAPFGNASENNNVLHLSKTNDETGNNIPGEVCELSFPGTRFDRQPHIHHINGVEPKKQLRYWRWIAKIVVLTALNCKTSGVNRKTSDVNGAEPEKERL